MKPGKTRAEIAQLLIEAVNGGHPAEREDFEPLIHSVSDPSADYNWSVDKTLRVLSEDANDRLVRAVELLRTRYDLIEG